MDIEFVAVGTELLLGFTHDTNARDLARALAPVGGRVVRRATVSDERRAIADAVGQALDRTGFVVTSGGLGPTSDDLTRDAVADELGLALKVEQAVLDDIAARFAQFQTGPMPASNRKQAEVPDGAEVLSNAHGSAPGLWIEGDRGTVVLLPGVPSEFRALTGEYLVPRVRLRTGAGHSVQSRTLRTTGISESALADRLAEHVASLDDLEVAFLPSLGTVDIRVTANGEEDAVGRMLDAAENLLRPILGNHLYGVNDDDLAAKVVEMLRQRRAQVAVAESCTGGLIAARLTEVAGASDTFLGGIVSYANEAKMRDLGVAEDLIERGGAVSEEVAQAMVRGVTDRFGVEAGIAVTGVAGPAGGTSEKPVGTVCMAAAWRSEVQVVTRHVPGSRHDVRRRAAQAALDLLRRML